jgi:hypothetical protein
VPTLSFDGDTHGEIVQKVRRWLASLEGAEEGDLSVVEAINQGAELTKDALRIIASAAPGPIADSEVVKALTGLGYKATDATREALVDGLGSVEELTGGSVVTRVREVGKSARKSAVYQMNSTVARQLLKTLKPR